MIIDRGTDSAFVALVVDAKRFLQEQHPSPVPGTLFLDGEPPFLHQRRSDRDAVGEIDRKYVDRDFAYVRFSHKHGRVPYKMIGPAVLSLIEQSHMPCVKIAR